MTATYLWAKLLKKLRLSAIRNSTFEKPSKVNTGSLVYHSTMGHYSYCGYDCALVNCDIGRFCSIAAGVSVGGAGHPTDWVSSSPAFYLGRDSIPKNWATLSYDPFRLRTTIGSDVWIGAGAFIKAGITVGNGAVIGMGSIVTHDVPPYAIVAGNPARVIRLRFVPELIARLDGSRWWELEPAALKGYAPLMSCPEEFLKALEERM